MEENKLMEKMALIVKAFDSISTDRNKDVYTEEDKKRAAYALNMCTVSVSQIVDYADVNVLEQEYEAILNNLNLEQMPKDEALLHILRQLLDTITYFRIQAGEKEMIEKEYQQKMKNAIWNAVPNFGLIVAGGNPVTMAISLASQVGIGYMNYRRSKAETSLEKDRKEWELRKTAIEQLNGLRRELFDTAWRLADTYDFPDEYRLTERQIAQYNKILMDQDEVRKYERLESIKGKFKAYPPFWYFIGNAANYIAGDMSLGLSDESRAEYRKTALEYFEHYEELNKFNILREDQLVASCALEHIDLLMLESKPDKTKIKELLDQAVKSSGNAFDILELCAITYLRIGDQVGAAEILRILVNEDYNRIINAQMLSSIYVFQQDRTKYELLASRVDPDYLFPMPQAGEDLENLQVEFGSKQKAVLKLKYKRVIESYLDKYSIEWNKLTSTFDINMDYPDEYFLDTEKAKAERGRQARKLYADNTKKEYYQQRLSESSYELRLLDILNELSSNVFASAAFADGMIQEKVEIGIRESILDNRDDINALQQAMDKRDFPMQAYLLSQTINLRSIVGKAFEVIIDNALSKVDTSNINDITFLEGNLRAFCNANGLPAPEIVINRGSKNTGIFTSGSDTFGPELFGSQAVMAKKNADFMAEMVSLVKEKMNSADLLNTETAIFFRGDSEFNGYFYNAVFEKYPDISSHAVMVLQDKTKRKFDLIFTTDGIVSVIKNKVKNITPYAEVTLKGDCITLYRGELKHTRDYKVTSFDINSFYALIKNLGTRFVRNIDDKMEFIDGTVGPKVLNQWFKEQKGAMDDGITRIYAIPTKETLSHLGYCLEDELDSEHNILQCYYDTNTGDILGLRVVQFENIDSNFQAYLIEHDGLIRVEK